MSDKTEPMPGIEYQIARLDLAPGDVLVVKICKEISKEDTGMIRSAAWEVAKKFGATAFMVLPHFDFEVMRKEHASDCAVHNAPALPVGPRDCGAEG